MLVKVAFMEEIVAYKKSYKEKNKGKKQEKHRTIIN